MKTQSLLYGALFTAVLLSSGCKSTSKTNSNTDTTVSANFTFATVSENTLNINLIDMQGVTLPNTKLSLYAQNPIDATNGVFMTGIDTLATSQTDANGSVNFTLNVPNTTNSLFIVTNCLGYNNPTVVDLNPSGTTNLTIAPAGYTDTKVKVAPTADNTTNTRPVNIQKLRGNIYTMSGWDSNGLPDYRTTINDVIPTPIITMLSATLPEGWAPTHHPEFFKNPKSANINLIEDANIWVTFVSEGAGYRSAMGYFTYPTAEPPTSAASISGMYIIYPNVSFPNSGGNLSVGTKVQLVVSDGNNGYTSRIAAGTSIGWFVISNGFNGTTVGAGNWTLYSFDSFNPGGYQQTIVLNDPINKINFISFEDITRTNASCDGDYNDVIFYCTASPYTAIDQNGIPVIKPPKDTDGDGVIDNNDAYPNDPTLAYDSYYPAKNVFGTLAYEDLWPSTGDYDFNDLVVDFNFHQQLNAQNLVVNIRPTFKLRAVGSSFHNGFALGLNTTHGNIKSVSGTNLTANVFTIGANGAETGNSNAVIPIFADGFTLFGNKPFTNTVMKDIKMDPVVLNMVIQLTSPTSQAALGTAPYDPFLVIAKTRSREVHLMNHHPTALADMTLFGTGNDTSSPSAGKYYTAKNGKPWAIQTPVSFAYPIEKSSISNAYLKFTPWASSAGLSFPNWYSHTGGGYRNSNLIYSK